MGYHSPFLQLPVLVVRNAGHLGLGMTPWEGCFHTFAPKNAFLTLKDPLLHSLRFHCENVRKLSLMTIMASFFKTHSQLFFSNNFDTTDSTITIGKKLLIRLCYILTFYWGKKESILRIEYFNKLISTNLKAINLLKKLLTYFHYTILQIKYLWDSRIRSLFWEEMSLLRRLIFFFLIRKIR